MGTPRTPTANEGVHRYSVAHFLVALVLLLAAIPLAEDAEFGLHVEGVLMTVVLCSAVVAVGGRRRTFVTAAVLLTPAVVTRWVGVFRPDLVGSDLPPDVGGIHRVVIVRLLYFILTAPRVNSEV